LEIDPEFWTRPKRLGEQPSRVGHDATSATNDLVDTLNGHANVPGKGGLGQAERKQKLFEQYLARMRWDAIFWKHSRSPRWQPSDNPSQMLSQYPLTTHFHPNFLYESPWNLSVLA